MSIGSGNGLVPNRRQAITWTKADPVHRRINTTLGGDELSESIDEHSTPDNNDCNYLSMPSDKPQLTRTSVTTTQYLHEPSSALQRRHNGRDCVSNQQPHHCLLNRFQTQIKENIKAPRHWPLCGEFIGDRWIRRTNGQLRGKCFHLMTSSWLSVVDAFLERGSHIKLTLAIYHNYKTEYNVILCPWLEKPAN